LLTFDYTITQKQFKHLEIMKTLTYKQAIAMLQNNPNAYLHEYNAQLKFTKLENNDGENYRITELTFEKLTTNKVIKEKRTYKKVGKYTYSDVTNVLA